MKKISFEDLKNYTGFEEIEKKVEFINSNRCICEYLIRELNQGIDLDYVKQSELLEENRDHELSDFVFDENIKVLRSEPKLPFHDMINAKDEEGYHEILDRQHDESTLVLLKTGADGKTKVSEIKTPSHLIAVSYALRQARRDKKHLKETGEMPEIDRTIIEKVNEMIMADKLEYGPIVGYGNFRHSIWSNGAWYTSNVRLVGDPWTPTESDYVEDEMNALMDEYNSSNLHPILKAIMFKVKFVKIHPFRDGNGRTSRILLNYMLVRNGFPTVTIRGRQKDKYFEAMNQAIINDDYSIIIDIIKKLLNKRCDKYISIIEECAKEKGVDIITE